MLAISCPSCGLKLAVPEAAVGTTKRCASCRNPIHAHRKLVKPAHSYGRLWIAGALCATVLLGIGYGVTTLMPAQPENEITDVEQASLGDSRLLPPGSFLAVPNANTEWTGFRGPQGSGITTEKLQLAESTKELWSANVGQGNASLIIHKERVYTIGRVGGANRVQCLDAATGKNVWSVRVDTWCRDSSVAYDDGRLFALCSGQNPKLLCLSAANGKQIWERELPAPTGGKRHYNHTGSPVVAGDRVVVNAGLGVAVDKKSGKVLWSHEGLPGLATPVLFRQKNRDGVILFGGDKLLARDLKTGRQLWSLPWKTNLAVNAADPIYHDGKVFISTTYGKHAAMFDVSNNEPRQLWKTGGSSFSTGFRSGNHVYCFASGRFTCYDWKSGERQWTVGRIGGGSAIVVDGKIILMSERGQLQIAPLSAKEFRPTISERVAEGTTWTPISYSKGRLFVRNKDGAVVCLKISK